MTHMRLPRRGARLIALLAAAAMLPTAVSVAGATGQLSPPAYGVGAQESSAVSSEGEPPVLSGAEALAVDMAGFAKDFGISETEMRRQYDVQEALAAVDWTGLDDGYAEYGTDPGKAFRVWYRTTRTPNQDVIDAMKSAGAYEYLKVVQVPLSLEELESRAQRVWASVHSRDASIGVSIDTLKGAAVLHPAGPWTADSAARARAAAEGFNVPVVLGSSLPHPTTIGGKRLSTSIGGCTGGFVVESASGARSLTSAGHCAQLNEVVAYSGGNGFTVRDRLYDHDHDVLEIDRAGETWNPAFDDGSAWRYVTGRKFYSGMAVGDLVSKYGITSGRTRGTVRSIYACSALGCNPGVYWVSVAPTDDGGWLPPGETAKAFVWDGDSGGPVFNGGIAWGLVSSRTKDCAFPGAECKWLGIFMPQQRIGDLGLTVVVS